MDIIENMPNRVVKIISEPDRGIYDALNKGIASSNGDVIGFLHADDIFASPHTIENIAQKFKINHNHGTYGNLLYVHKENTDKIIRHWKSKPFNPNSLILGWMPAHPTLFLKKRSL